MQTKLRGHSFASQATPLQIQLEQQGCNSPHVASAWNFAPNEIDICPFLLRLLGFEHNVCNMRSTILSRSPEELTVVLLPGRVSV